MKKKNRDYDTAHHNTRLCASIFILYLFLIVGLIGKALIPVVYLFHGAIQRGLVAAGYLQVGHIAVYQYHNIAGCAQLHFFDSF